MLRTEGPLGRRVPLGIDGMVDTFDTLNALWQKEGARGKTVMKSGGAAPAHQALNALTRQALGMSLSGFRASTRDRKPMAPRQWGQALKRQSTADEGPSLVWQRDEDANRPHGFQVLRSLWKRDRAHSGKNLS